jgi:FlaA1/EpsC-like NDP-sugar epimerase
MKTASLPDRAALRGSGSLPTAVFAAIRRLRGRHLVATDAIGLTMGVWLALNIAGAPLGPLGIVLVLPAAIPIIVRLAVNVWAGLYQRLWVHASVPDLLQVVVATVVGTGLGMAIVSVVSLIADPASVRFFTPTFWFLEMMMALGVLGTSRFAIRAVGELATRGSADEVPRIPALLFGAGREGAVLTRSALGDRRARVLPVGFLDSDETRWGNTIAGLKVFGGLSSLDAAIRETGAQMLLITTTNAPGAFVRKIMAAAHLAGLEVRRVPAVHELLDGSLDTSRIRRIRVEDLLTREQVTTHAPGVETIIRGKVVMVTGAGGSIGSELARQIFALHPRKLVLVDRAESPLYMIERELGLRNLANSSTELSVHIANVVSRKVMGRLIEAARPSVIFHAAAYKHVPMMEEHPSDGVHVNVGGTYAVLDAAVDAGVERFVLVSTDKAVEPTSVMGATKRLAEWLVADAALKTGRPYVAVRFGNVLGSAGSVLPIFERQLERGEPLTVTHPEMTRYFMTIQEAGWLILDAAAIGTPGDLFVLDMGDPVSILDMARDLVRLAGQDPMEVEIVFTGLRPGEKLTEKLYYDAETVRETDVPKIARVLNPEPPPDVSVAARNLLVLADGDHDEELRESLFATVAAHGAPQPPSRELVAVLDERRTIEGAAQLTLGYGESSTTTPQAPAARSPSGWRKPASRGEGQAAMHSATWFTRVRRPTARRFAEARSSETDGANVLRADPPVATHTTPDRAELRDPGEEPAGAPKTRS